jgi:hypothetical protein
MLPDLTLPPSLLALLACFQPLFTTPSFRTFCALAAGFVAQTGRRTVCGMLTGAGLSQAWRHDRAHRFFSHARWSSQDLGLRSWSWRCWSRKASRCWWLSTTPCSSGPGRRCTRSAGFTTAPPRGRIRWGWATIG